MTKSAIQSRPVRLDIDLKPRILDRYMMREFLIGYAVAVGVVLGLRIVLDLFAQFDEFVEGSTPQASASIGQVLAAIGLYYGPRLFEYFRDFSGMIIMTAAGFSLVRLNRNNEFTAILASGISLKRVMAPVLAMGILFNGLMIFDQEIILPRLADRLTLDVDDINGMDIMRLPLIADQNGDLFTAQQFDPQNQILVNMVVILRNDGLYAGQIQAPRAQWDESLQQWDLVEGTIIRNGRPEPLAAYITPLLTPEFLLLREHSNFKSLVSSTQLTELLHAGNLRQMDYQMTLNEKYFRFTDPIINMIMLLLALPLLASRERRGESRVALGLALVGPVGCFVMTFASKLMFAEWWDPMLAAWLPIIIFGPLSVLALDSLKT